MYRRQVLGSVAALTGGALAGCTDDGTETPDDGGIPSEPEEVPEGSDPEGDASGGRTPPEETAAAFLNADAEGDGEAANRLMYDDDPFPEEMDPIPEPELLTVAEWDSVDAITSSGGLPESEAEGIVDELETERASVVESDPDVDALTYVFTAMSSAEIDELYYLMTLVQVDDDWLVSEYEQILST